MAIRLTGMASGLDTESMITDLMSAYNGTKQKKVSNMTKYSWKMEAWSSLNKKVNNFYSKALSNLRFSSSYSSKKTSASDTSKASVTAGSGAVVGTQTLAIKQLAQSGYLTGGVIADKNGDKISEKSTLADLGYVGDEKTTISVKSGADGAYKTIEISKDTKISDFVKDLNSAGLNASFDAKNQRIFVNSKSSGASGDFQLIGDTDKSIEALQKLGLYSGVTPGGEEAKTYQRFADMISNSEIDESAEAGHRLTGDALAAYDAELTTRIDALKERKVEAKDKLDDINFQIKNLTDQLDGYTDAFGESHTGIRTTVTGNADYVSAKAKAAEILGKIAGQDSMTDEEKAAFEETKKEYGLDKLSAEDLGKVTEETLIDTTLKLEANKASKALSEASEEDKEALKARVDSLNSLIKDNTEMVKLEKKLTTAQEEQTKQQGILDDINTKITENGEAKDELIQETEDFIIGRAKTAQKVMNGDFAASSSAVRLNGQNAQIYLNGAFFESDKNSFEINSLTINVTGTTGLSESGKDKVAAGQETGASDYNTISLTTSTDVDGIYKNIKNFLKEYNDLIKEMDTKYSADSAAKYDVLTNEEKDAMSDSEVEAWEKKIKDSLLRRDDSLSSLIDSMKGSMQKSYQINGTTYSLASFGIETMSYFLAPEGEKGVYHIDGDEDDTDTSSNPDKLKAMISSNPEDVQEFFTKLTNDMYNTLQKKASSTVNSSYGAFYEDKFMSKQYDTYKSQLSDYESKLQDIEDKYYKQFSAMETALTKLQSSTTAISGLLGMG